MDISRELIVDAFIKAMLQSQETHKLSQGLSIYVDAIPDGEKTSNEDLIDKLHVKGLDFEKRPYGGIYALNTDNGDILLQNGVLMYNFFDVGNVLSKDTDAVAQLITGLPEIIDYIQSCEAEARECINKSEADIDFMLEDEVKSILASRKRGGKWEEKLNKSLSSFKEKLNTSRVLSEQARVDTYNTVVTQMKNIIEYDYKEYLRLKENRTRKADFGKFEKCLQIVLADYEYNIQRYKPMYGTDSFRLLIKLPYDTIEYSSSLYTYCEQLPEILTKLVPVAIEVNSQLGRKYNYDRLRRLNDEDLMDRFLQVWQKAVKVGVRFK